MTSAQGCSAGAGTRWNAVPANILEPERRSRTHPQHGYTPCAGAQAPALLGPRFRRPFPQIKIYHLHPCICPKHFDSYSLKHCEECHSRQTNSLNLIRVLPVTSLVMHRLEEVLNLKNLYKYLIYLTQQKCVARCRVVVVLDCPVATKRSQAQPSALPLSCDNRRQVVHTLMPESRSVIYYMYIIWYQRCPMARRADATVIKNDPEPLGVRGAL